MDVGLLSTPPEVAARPGFQRLSLMSEAEVAALWADYFVFTVTRDPFDRAVSQYGFLMRSNLAEPQECRDAVSAPLHCNAHVHAWGHGGVVGGACACVCLRSTACRGWWPGCVRLQSSKRTAARAAGVSTAMTMPTLAHVCPPTFCLSVCLPACLQTEQLVDWDTFCADPPSMARFCAQRPHCCKDVEGVYEVGGARPGRGSVAGPCAVCFAVFVLWCIAY